MRITHFVPSSVFYSILVPYLTLNPFHEQAHGFDHCARNTQFLHPHGKPALCVTSCRHNPLYILIRKYLSVLDTRVHTEDLVSCFEDKWAGNTELTPKPLLYV